MFGPAITALQAMSGSARPADPVGESQSRSPTLLPFPGAGLATAAGPSMDASAIPAFDFMAVPGMDVLSDAVDYWVDSAQRWVLFWDCMRRAAMPSARADAGPDRWTEADLEVRALEPDEGVRLDPAKRPIVVFDPRAGTAAGEGGINETVRQALYAGHVVYHATLAGDAAAGAPGADALDTAQAAVLAAVAARHPAAAEGPCRIGSARHIPDLAALCLLQAERIGALKVDAVPSAYWCGLDETSPYRAPGCLAGGQWLASLDRDLGPACQDGSLRAAAPLYTDTAARFWDEPYGLYAAIDTDEEAFLTRAGQRAAQVAGQTAGTRFRVGGPGLAGAEPGCLLLDDGRAIDLTTIETPVLLFAADRGRAGVTAALRDAFGSEDAIRRAGRVVVAARNAATDLVSILVTPSRPRGPNRGLSALSPGLYTLEVREVPHPDAAGTPVRWDLELALAPQSFETAEIFEGPAAAPTPAIDRAAQVSESLDWHYKFALRPMVRLCATPTAGHMMRSLRPARAWQRILSGAAPALKALAAMVREDRRPAAPDNEFVAAERSFARQIGTVIATLCRLRDQAVHNWFRLVFEIPVWPAFGR